MNAAGETLVQDIIPGLPDDLALSCLAKVSHGYHGLLENVSKGWREALRSSDYSRVKATQGSCGNWLFVLTENNLFWEAYDPQADRWHPLPLMPRSEPDLCHHGFSCVTLCKRLFVLGGCYAQSPSKYDPSYEFHCSEEKEDVMFFDSFEKNWRRATGMRNARSDFACASICGKIYVAGGSYMTAGLTSAEVYDPVQDRWDELPQMPVPLEDCFSISYGDRFHVVGKTDRFKHQHDKYLIFDPSNGSWEIEDDLWPLGGLERQATLVMNDSIFTVDSSDMIFKVIDADRRGSYNLSIYPSVILPDHKRSVHPFRNGFLELHGKFYFFGGKAVKYDVDALEFSVVKLNMVRCCDPQTSLVEWREVRSMFKTCGAVVGCASMEEDRSYHVSFSKEK